MTLETTVTYVSDLNPAYPAENEVGTLHEGNDHIRNIKKAVTGTFPNITGPVTATQAELNVLAGITASTAELNILDGVTASAAELNILDGATVSTAELNLLVGQTDLGVEQEASSATLAGQTTVTLTSIPDDTFEIILTFSGLAATNPSDMPIVRLGDAGGIETSGYTGRLGILEDSFTSIAFSTAEGFLLGYPITGSMSGVLRLCRIATSNAWVANGLFANTLGHTLLISGVKATSGTLDRISISTTLAATFSGGTYGVRYLRY